MSQVRLQPVTEQAATATAAGSGAQTAQTTTVPTVVSYTAIVDVANPDQRLRPGMTAEVVVSESQRDARRPHSEQRVVVSAAAGRVEGDRRNRAGRSPKEQGVREVWEYDGKRFMPIAVHAGMADGGWTELLSGNVREGDSLVTSASYASLRTR